jgi:exodeoxyribonuclease-3
MILGAVIYAGTTQRNSMLRVITLNLNGIRSATAKGVWDWLAQQKADLICVQELKAQAADLSAEMLAPAGYHGHFHYAEKKGYSGVGIYSLRQPDNVAIGFGVREFDDEGRYVRADFGALSLISVYLPSGSSGEHRQESKFRFLEVFRPHLAAMKAEGREFIVCGDLNIAHNEIDLKNWRGNRKNSGFLPEERAWLSGVFEDGWVDVFRRIDQRPDQYTWWSNRGQAWAKNVGWRIDYQIATPGVAAAARQVSIYTEQRFSDHAPLTIDYELSDAKP